VASMRPRTSLVDRSFSKAKGPIPSAFSRGAEAGQYKQADTYPSGASKSGKFSLKRGALANSLSKAHSNAISKGGDEQVSGKRVRAKAYLAGYKSQTGLAGGGGSARGRQRRDARGRFA